MARPELIARIHEAELQTALLQEKEARLKKRKVGGGVAVAVRGGGDLLTGEAGQDRPAAGGEGQGLAERGAGHGRLHGWVLAGAGSRG